jgi:DNA-binding PadR family transcriptional regulator
MAKWGVSENNRKARYYSITRGGLKQLAIETENWEEISGVIARGLACKGRDNYDQPDTRVHGKASDDVLAGTVPWRIGR